MNDRDVVDLHRECVERLLDLGVAVDVEVAVGLAVARQELLQLQRARRVARPDQQRVGAAIGHEGDPTQQEGPEQHLAELGVGLHELTQPLGRQLEDARRAAGAPLDDDRTTGQQVDVPAELPGPVHGHDVVGAGEDRDPALEHDEERPVAVSLLPENLPVDERAFARQGLDSADRLRSQHREDLGPVWPGNDRGTRRIGAGFALAHEADLSTRPFRRARSSTASAPPARRS